MIGKKQIQLGYDQFIAGMASSDYAGDGALGTASTGINPYTTQGVIRATATLVDAAVNISGNIIASCEDSQVTSPNDRIMKDDDFQLYSVSGGVVTKQIVSFIKTYRFGITDMVSYAGQTYCSSTTHLAQINTSAWTMTETFKTFNDAQAHHPLLVYGGLLYFGDGNLLKSCDASGTVVTVLTLVTTEKIVTLGIDPGSGYMLISAQNSYNPTDTIQQRGYIYMYDGVSTTFARKIVMDDMVSAFYAVGGTVYVGTGQNLGVWNGAGVTFLRKLVNVTATTNELPYKHHFAHVRNILLVADGVNVLAYGEVIAGKKAFYPFSKNPTNTAKLIALIPTGGTTFGLSFTGSNFKIGDIGSTATGTGTLTFSNIFFPRPIFVRRMRVVTTGIAHTGSTDMTISITDETGTALPISSANRIRSVPTGTTYTLDFDFGGAKCQAIQPIITMTNGNYGIYKVVIYYDVAE